LIIQTLSPESQHLTMPLAQRAPSNTPDFTKARVAIVHEWFVNYAGSERVVEQLLHLFPQADLYAVVDFLEPHERGFLGGRVAKTTFIQNLPRARKSFRAYLPLMPLAIEQHDLSAYDLVISSSHAVAKGVLTGPDQFHVCYVHSPIRYAWDLQHQYLQEAGLTKGPKSWLTRLILHYMRMWDVRTAHGVDLFIANSQFIARRIKKVYGRDSVVVYPPVDVDAFTLREDKEDFYLTAGRMAPYKRVPMIVEAFNQMPDKKLVVIGEGPDFEKVKAMAGPNITLLGYQPFDVLRDHMQRAKAFVFAAEEDFGITPVEAQACGTPVIAFGKGGAFETVVGLSDALGGSATGVFFYEQTCGGICETVSLFEKTTRVSPLTCRAQATKFSIENFRLHIAKVFAGTVGTPNNSVAEHRKVITPVKPHQLATGTKAAQ
jgi:glycosyltransferase involved in cell wall biosynthesis